jgi:hypothetical protein
MLVTLISIFYIIFVIYNLNEIFIKGPTLTFRLGLQTVGTGPEQKPEEMKLLAEEEKNSRKCQKESKNMSQTFIGELISPPILKVSSY